MSQDNKQGAGGGQQLIMTTPKSQIKLTQIINNTGGAVAAVPYYTRKPVNAGGGPSEISSQ